MPARRLRPTDRPLLHLVIAALVAVAVLAGGLPRPDRAEADSLDCDVTWDGGAGTDSWTDDANWTGDVAPLEGEVACVASGGPDAVVVDAPGDVEVYALYVNGGLILRSGNLMTHEDSYVKELGVSGGRLTVFNGSTLTATSASQDGGEVSGDGNIDVEGTFAWGGGAQTGQGTTATGTTGSGGLRVDGIGAGRRLIDRHLSAGPDSAWLSTGGIELGGTAVLAVGDLDLTDDSLLLTGTGQVIVDGDIVSHDQAVSIEPNLTLEPESKIEVHGVTTLSLEGLLNTYYGDVLALDGARLQLGGTQVSGVHSFEDGSWVEAPGPVDVGLAEVALKSTAILGDVTATDASIAIGEGASPTVDDLTLGTDSSLELATDLTVGGLTLDGGEVHGDRTLTAGLFFWKSGEMNGAGITAVTGGTAIQDGATHHATDRTLQLADLDWLADETLTLDGAATLDVSGTLTAHDHLVGISGPGTVDLRGALDVERSILAVESPLTTHADSSADVADSSVLRLLGGGGQEAAFHLDETSALDLGGSQLMFPSADISGAGTVTIAEGAQVLTGGATEASELVVHGDLTLADTAVAGRLTTDGNLTVNDGVRVVVLDQVTQTDRAVRFETATASLAVANGYLLQGGTLGGLGTVDGSVVNSGGTVQVGGLAGSGDQGGETRITGDYTQTGQGRIEAQIGEVVQDRLLVDGTADLSGTLDVEVVDHVEPGTPYEVLRGGSRTGLK